MKHKLNSDTTQTQLIMYNRFSSGNISTQRTTCGEYSFIIFYNALYVSNKFSRMFRRVTPRYTQQKLPIPDGQQQLGAQAPEKRKSDPSVFKQTRWSPRTRMPTRMLRNRDNTYLSHIPTSPLVGHPDLTHWGDTLVGHPCLTLLRNALVKHFYLTLLWDTLAWQFFWGTLTWHSCRTLLTWHFLLDTLTWGSCKTFLLDTSYLTLLWDTLTWHFLLEILTWHSCRTLLPDTLVRHSYLTLL